MLLAPVAAQLGNKRLVIVASGMLEYLPFAALPEPQPADNPQFQPLIANHEIVNLPSASVLALLRGDAATRQAATKTVAVLADPVFAANDPRIAIIAKSSKPKAVAAPPTMVANSNQSGNGAIATDLNRAVRDFN